MAEEQTASPTRIDWSLGITWILATLAAAAIASAGFLLLLLSECWSYLIGLYLFATVQWLALRYTLGVSAWWIPATVVGLAAIAAGLLVGSVVAAWGGAGLGLLYALTMGGAALLGALQTLLLRRKLRGVAWWFVATLAGTAGILLLLTTEPLAERAFDLGLGQIGLVALYALTSGLTLALLGRRRPADPGLTGRPGTCR